MMNAIRRLLVGDEAATAVEYAVMLGLILMAAFASIALLGTENATSWTTIDTEMQAHGVGS